MTAAAWQYIGSQGIVGRLQSFTGAAERFGGTLAGRSVLTAGCGGMGGAQALAGKMAGAGPALGCRSWNLERLQRRIATGYLDRVAGSIDEALAWMGALQQRGEGGSVGLAGNVVDVHEALLARGWQPDVVTDQVTVDPLRGYVASGLRPAQMEALVKRDPPEALRRGDETLVRHARALVEFRRRGALVLEYRRIRCACGPPTRATPRH